MYIPPWAWSHKVPPHLSIAWAKATAGAALTLLAAGAYVEDNRLSEKADRIEVLSPQAVRAAYPELKSSFTELNRDQAIETCYWHNTPTPACADMHEVKQVASELRHQASVANISGLILGVGAIGALASALRGLNKPKAP